MARRPRRSSVPVAVKQQRSEWAKRNKAEFGEWKSAKFSVALDGDTNLRKALRALPDQLKNMVRHEVEKTLKGTRNMARRNIKMNFKQRTRTLWRNTHYVMDMDGLGGSVGAYNEAFYGHWLEFGKYNRKTGAKVKARPWLWPAFYHHRPLFRKRLVNVVKKLRLQGVKL